MGLPRSDLVFLTLEPLACQKAYWWRDDQGFGPESSCGRDARAMGHGRVIQSIQRNRLTLHTSMGMTLREIDEALAGWNRRLTAMADNLMSLQSESTYRVLTGSGGAKRVQITGETAARVEPALAAMHTIFEQFGVLHSTVDRAVKIREGLPTLFGGDEKIAEIQQVLFGRSIEPPAIDVPFAQRTLLSGAPSQQRLTLEELLGPMMRTFSEARDAVLAVDRAWQETAVRAGQAEERLQQLITRAQSAGCGPASEGVAALNAASALVAQTNEQLRVDPMGAMAAFQSRLEPAFARLNRMVDAAERVASELHRAHAVLDGLGVIHREALDAATEAKAKVMPKQALARPVGEEKLLRLREWLDQLDRRWKEDAQDTVAAGLRNWHEAACVIGKDDTAARDMSRAAVEARRELRGRLEALKAKARALGVAEDAAIAAIAAEAESVIQNKPTDLERAAAGVAAYASAVSQARREPKNSDER